jgi:hypothetical protein
VIKTERKKKRGVQRVENKVFITRKHKTKEGKKHLLKDLKE